MKRFHLNLTVADLDRSIAFYSALFDAEPTISKSDYAKWLVDDPQLNFSITTRGSRAGINHAGLQFDEEADLSGIRERLNGISASTFDQENAACCYARSDKAWVRDPDEISWEAFVTHEQTQRYGEDAAESNVPSHPKARCCAPSTAP